MKCPHCEYEHVDDWSVPVSEHIDGGIGGFFEGCKMQRGWYTTALYACPKCKKTFIDN